MFRYAIVYTVYFFVGEPSATYTPLKTQSYMTEHLYVDMETCEEYNDSRDHILTITKMFRPYNNVQRVKHQCVGVPVF